MATTIRMPEVLANVTEAAIQAWSVGVGDTVAVGQPFAEIETDKAVVEYAAETAGTVLQLLVAEGDQVDVGAPIAVIGEPGESVGSADAAPAAPAAAPGSPPESDPESAAPVADAEPVYDLPQEAVTTTDAAADAAPSVAPASGRRFVSPLVRRLARERGLSLDSVTGTGPGGRIVRKDLERLEQAGPETSGPAAPRRARDGDPAGRSVRRALGGRGARARAAQPHAQDHRAPAHRVEERGAALLPHGRLPRRQAPRPAPRAQRAGTVKVSVNDLVVKAVAGAFVDVPEANRTWTDEGMLQHRSVDIAIAVSLDDGLVTPVVRGVEGLSVSALGRQIVDLAERARSGGLRQHEIEGGSFAVSNLGMFGTQEFSAIINPPQAGILAVGAARQAPVVVDGALEVGTLMSVTLSADHRALDGALAARWLAAFVARIEHPLTILA